VHLATNGQRTFVHHPASIYRGCAKFTPLDPGRSQSGCRQCLPGEILSFLISSLLRRTLQKIARPNCVDGFHGGRVENERLSLGSTISAYKVPNSLHARNKTVETLPSQSDTPAFRSYNPLHERGASDHFRAFAAIANRATNFDEPNARNFETDSIAFSEAGMGLHDAEGSQQITRWAARYRSRQRPLCGEPAGHGFTNVRTTHFGPACCIYPARRCSIRRVQSTKL
jgi:hypothetical protein